MQVSSTSTLGLQRANVGTILADFRTQSRYYLETLEPKVGNICILGAPGYGSMMYFPRPQNVAACWDALVSPVIIG